MADETANRPSGGKLTSPCKPKRLLVMLGMKNDR